MPERKSDYSSHLWISDIADIGEEVWRAAALAQEKAVEMINQSMVHIEGDDVDVERLYGGAREEARPT